MNVAQICLTILLALLYLGVPAQGQTTNQIYPDIVGVLRALEPESKSLPQEAVSALSNIPAAADTNTIADLCAHIDWIDPEYDPSLGSLKPVELSFPITAALIRIGTPALEELNYRIEAETDGKRLRLLKFTRERIMIGK